MPKLTAFVHAFCAETRCYGGELLGRIEVQYIHL